MMRGRDRFAQRFAQKAGKSEIDIGLLGRSKTLRLQVGEAVTENLEL